VLPDLLLQTTGACFLFLLTEIMELVIVVRDEGGWKWRFGEVEGYDSFLCHRITKWEDLVYSTFC
jgi:hypothetical protein